MASMVLEELPTEILLQVFTDLPSVAAVVNLSSTCRRLRGIYKSSQRQTILCQAAEAEFGPLEDICQLITHNDSQSAHVRRAVNISDAVIHQIVRVGRVAQKWTTVYPLYKWRESYEDRRLLTTEEEYALRRGLYRLWLFDKAFHTPTHCQFYSRMWPQQMQERTLLLHNFNTAQLAEMLDVHLMIRDLIAYELCPSDKTLRLQVADLHGGSGIAVPAAVDIHLTYGLVGLRNLESTPVFAAKDRGWGDEIRHYYIVEDMMKLGPDQVLLLHSWRQRPSQVLAYLSELGDWFNNNGEIFSETLGHVARQRGSDLEELKIAIRAEQAGIAADV